MKTVLFAWELGEGLGHVGPLRSVARELSARGHRAVFAVRDVVGSRALVNDEDYPVLQAPIWPKRAARGGIRPVNYADILANRGFANVDDLAPMVAAWQDLFDLVKPDLMVADYSPTACLTAYEAVPVALIGVGSTLPPADLPEFPSMRPEIPPIVPEHRLLEVVHKVQRRRNRPAPDPLPRLLDSPVRSVCTLPELDPYFSVRNEPVLGPMESLLAPTPLPEEPALFAYVAADFENIEDVVLCLADMDVPVSIYIGGGAGSLARFLKGRGIHVYDAPAPLTEVLPKVSAVLSHGGTIAAHAVMAGRPQVVLPRHGEARFIAEALEALGVGVQLSEHVEKENLRNALHQVLYDPIFRDRALGLARAIEDRCTVDALSLTVDGCLELLGS